LDDDRKLWERISRGDSAAFDGFYRENGARLRNFLRQLLGNTQTAEDVMQETFLQFWYKPALARVPFPGAVEGKVEDGRVNFEMKGEHYQFAAAAPITRAETLWVRFGSRLKPSELAPELRDDQGSFGTFRLSAASSQTR
jgi:Sigma-70 region 2